MGKIQASLCAVSEGLTVMKIDELFEALPGVNAPWYSKIFNRPDAKIKASIDQGTKAWVAFAKNLSKQGRFTSVTPQQSSEIFRSWSANAMNLPPKHPAMNKIIQELAAELVGDNSEKPIRNAVTKLVNLSQTLAAAGPEARYTPEMKAQAVFNVLHKKYGKFIKDIATQQAFEKFINDAVKANPDISVDDLKTAAEAEISKITAAPAPAPRGTPPAARKRPKVGDIVKYNGKQYTWTNRAWRAGTDVLTGSDARAANAIFRRTP